MATACPVDQLADGDAESMMGIPVSQAGDERDGHPEKIMYRQEDGIAVDGFSHINMKKNTTSWWLQCGQKTWT